MFNVYVKRMNQVLDCYKTYEVEEDNKFVTYEIKYMCNV